MGGVGYRLCLIEEEQLRCLVAFFHTLCTFSMQFSPLQISQCRLWLNAFTYPCCSLPCYQKEDRSNRIIFNGLPCCQTENQERASLANDFQIFKSSVLELNQTTAKLFMKNLRLTAQKLHIQEMLTPFQKPKQPCSPPHPPKKKTHPTPQKTQILLPFCINQTAKINLLEKKTTTKQNQKNPKPTKKTTQTPLNFGTQKPGFSF